MMANKSAHTEAGPPAIVYAQLLFESQRLIDAGMGDSPEAESLADRMDDPWYAMTAKEQIRMEGLSVDLYALADGGPKCMDMSSEQIATWKEAFKERLALFDAGDVDSLLDFLRQPMPASWPKCLIPYFQARCWGKLGDMETAKAFMKEADRLDPHPLKEILRDLGRTVEMPWPPWLMYPASSPLEQHLASAGMNPQSTK